MLTGSLVSSLQGEPRSTHDIDLIVSVGPRDVAGLVSAFPMPRYYLSESAVRQAIAERNMFNLVETDTGDKVDFWMPTDDPFDRSRLARKQVEQILGIPVSVSQPEDTILAKLRWARLCGGSEKQFNDAKSVYEVQCGILDRTYLDDWAVILDVQDLWARLQSEARPIE